MLGLMQDWPLTVDKILEHANVNHGHREVVCRTTSGEISRSTYSQVYGRARQVSKALLAHGLEPSDRVATIGWNNTMHMETWYGAMSIGMVLHTVNPRLFPQQLGWMMNHAQDKAVFFDSTFLPLVEGLAPYLPQIKLFVLYGSDADLPDETKIPNLMSYDTFIGEHDGKDVVWGGFDENTACGLCYTSGTTGSPKGVLYSHRSNVLHTFITMQRDTMGLSIEDTLLMIVPMFHANAWGLTFAAPASGTKLVMPGPRMDGEAVHELIVKEGCNKSAAVPTIWLMLQSFLERTGETMPSLDSVLIGGAAVPESIVRYFGEKHGVDVVHAWGMTETSPLGTVCTPTPEFDKMSDETKMTYRLKQGRPPFGIELKSVNDDGERLPRDGKTSGRLCIRGPAVAKAYYANEAQILDDEGYFDTGDVANLCELGFMQITDRAKDVIKSGGEWISSIELENVALLHESVERAATIGVYHPKWDERPLLLVQLKSGAVADKESVLQIYQGRVAKWWVPDDVVFVDEIPLGPTGKIDKRSLRETYKDYVLPTI